MDCIYSSSSKRIIQVGNKFDFWIYLISDTGYILVYGSYIEVLLFLSKLCVLLAIFFDLT
jgi:hypothetical protein